jgi:hypothetical protein
MADNTFDTAPTASADNRVTAAVSAMPPADFPQSVEWFLNPCQESPIE